MKVFGDVRSGNCYKIQLVCSLLDIEHEWVPVDILAGDTRTETFSRLNPNARIPVIELADGRCLSESNAIINFLAHGSDLLPSHPFELAKVQQWQFFEQYSHEPCIAVARFIAKYLGMPDARRAEFESKQAGGHKALRVMEAQLSNTAFLVGNALSTADVSLYAYTHVASEGGFDLGPYPMIRFWLSRIEDHPKYVRMG